MQLRLIKVNLKMLSGETVVFQYTHFRNSYNLVAQA